MRTLEPSLLHRPAIWQSNGVVSRSFGGERRRGDAGAWGAHGARRHGFGEVAQNRKSRSGTDVRRVWGFGGAKNAQNFLLMQCARADAPPVSSPANELTCHQLDDVRLDGRRS